MPDAAPPNPQSDSAAPLTPAVIDLAVNHHPQDALHNALRAYGFVAVRNAGVSADLLDRAFTSARRYFAQPLTTKLQDVYTDTNANFGYQGMLSEALDPQQAIDQADLKEAFTMRSLSIRSQLSETKDKSQLEKRWEQSEFGQTATLLHETCSAVALHLLSLIADALGSATDTFAQYHTGENMTLRYLHYPAAHSHDAKLAVSGKKMPQLGAGAHTDYGTITLLFSDGVPGLQLYDLSEGSAQGCWRNVEVAAGDVLVNTGDLMSLWSNGLYPSTLHRVQPRRFKPDRYSMAFFVDPDSKTEVRPLPSCLQQQNAEQDLHNKQYGSRDNNKANNNKEGKTAHPNSANVVVAGEHIQARIEASQRTLT